MIIIVNYGMGNLGSVQNMFKRIGVPSKISSDLNEIRDADKLLLPGVGAFDTAMNKLNQTGLKDILYAKVMQEKTPVLGICLGMQLLTNNSEEGVLPGLGWINAETVKFEFKKEDNLKIPHMGWNRVFVKKQSQMTEHLPDEPRYYFVHSYHVRCTRPEDVLATTHFGIEFHSMIQHENVYGAQFHPEKSHRYGMKLLDNFSKI